MFPQPRMQTHDYGMESASETRGGRASKRLSFRTRHYLHASPQCKIFRGPVLRHLAQMMQRRSQALSESCWRAACDLSKGVRCKWNDECAQALSAKNIAWAHGCITRASELICFRPLRRDVL